jgi:dCMP deaminase
MKSLPERPDRVTYFMLMAQAASFRGTCDRRRVGAVVTDLRHRVLATGYNGAPPGVQHCDHRGGGDEPCLVSDHAEYNALAHGMAQRVDADDGLIMYCTSGPCLRCAHLMVRVGVRRLVYAEEYRDPAGREWLKPRLESLVRWERPPDHWAKMWEMMQ